MRGTGLLDDAPSVRGSHSLEELLGASVRGDPCIDRTPMLAGEALLDQGQTGSCVRHAVARAIQIHARVHLDASYALPSPRYLTAVTRRARAAVQGEVPAVTLTDLAIVSGVIVLLVLVARWGEL